jgi:cytochrome c oxidase assembly factor CtaG
MMFGGACAAHGVEEVDVAHPLFDAALASLVAGVAVLYGRGVARIWRRAGTGRGVRVADAVRFALGMIAVATALLSPIDALADRSFALHMVEHELLMVVAAPLLVLARPLEASVWGLPRGARHAMASLARAPAITRLCAALTGPVAATVVHAIVLWVWHVPALFVAALRSLPLHVLQHLCFFVSALAFWWAVAGGGRRRAGPVSLACLFATMLQTSALGALLTFAPSPWYADPTQTRAFGLSALGDQQLGGLVMWVPGALAYVVVALWIVARWLARPSPTRARAVVSKATAGSGARA